MINIEEIYNEYFKVVYRYLFCLTLNNDKAEELTQETFYRAVQKIDSFNRNSKISSWLCQIAKYTFYQYLDKKNRKKEVSMDTVIETAAKQQLEKEYISGEYESLSVNQAIERCKELVYLFNKKKIDIIRIGLIFL